MDKYKAGFFAVIIGAAAIGTAPIFMRFADVSPSAAAFWRITLALPLLYLWMRLDPSTKQQIRKPAQNHKPAWLIPSSIVGFWFALDLFLWHWSVEKTTVANATLLANMATVFTAVVGFLFLGQRFQSRFVAGLACSVFGAVILVGQNASLAPEYLAGDILGLLTAIAYTGYIITGANARKHYSTAQIMFGSALITALLILPAALLEEGLFLPPSLNAWLPLLGLAWFSHFLGQSLIMYGLAHVPAALGSVTLLIQPVVSALLAWWLFAEILGPGHLFGAALIFWGIWLARKNSNKPVVGSKIVSTAE